MSKTKINFAPVIALLVASALQSFGQTIPPTTTEQADKLIAVLKSDAPYKEKADACRQLAVIGTKDAITPLAALLGDEKLSHMARYGLEPIPNPAVDEALRDALGRLKGRPLVGVIDSIGVRRDARAVGQLTKMLQEPNDQVAQAAARALGKIGNSASAKALQGALAKAPAANQLALCEGLFGCAEAFAAEGRRNKAIAIYDQLRSLQGPQQVRAGALRGAILTYQKDGLPLLRQYLRSDDHILFSTAVQTTQELPGTEVTRALTAVLNRLPTDNQILVLQTLGKRGDATAATAMFSLARSGAKSVRLAAIRALPELGQVSAVPVLVELLADADREISQAAQEGLAALPGRQADAAVMAMLNSSETSRRLTALELIGRRRMVTSVPALLKATGDTDPKVRPAALRKVGELGSPAELPRLLDILMHLKESQDIDAVERALIAVCAKADNPQSYTEKLIGLLAQTRAGQKSALLGVLSSIGGTDALWAVRTAADDSNAVVHLAAIRALGAWKTADAAPDLLALAKTAGNPNDKTLCLRGYLSLAAHNELPAEKRLSMCRQVVGLIQRNDEKKQLLGVLGGTKSADAVALVRPYMDDPATQEEACAASVSIAKKLLKKGQDDSKLAPELIEPLEKVVQVTADVKLASRAVKLLKRTEVGFVPIFNGKDLTDWDGDKRLWSVQDEIITGQSTMDNPLKNNTFLIWQGEKADDFDLRLSFHIESGNSGIQFRSRQLPNWAVGGYQADFDSKMTWTGGIYDELGSRGVMVKRGQKVVIDENGKKEITAFTKSSELLKRIKSDDWNDCYIIARGNKITVKVNCVVTSQLVDNEKGKAASSGIIALQLHAGKPMKVQFKDIRLKKLPGKGRTASGAGGAG